MITSRDNNNNSVLCLIKVYTTESLNLDYLDNHSLDSGAFQISDQKCFEATKVLKRYKIRGSYLDPYAHTRYTITNIFFVFFFYFFCFFFLTLAVSLIVMRQSSCSLAVTIVLKRQLNHINPSQSLRQSLIDNHRGHLYGYSNPSI